MGQTPRYFQNLKTIISSYISLSLTKVYYFHRLLGLILTPTEVSSMDKMIKNWIFGQITPGNEFLRAPCWLLYMFKIYSVLLQFLNIMPKGHYLYSKVDWNWLLRLIFWRNYKIGLNYPLKRTQGPPVDLYTNLKLLK